MRFTQDERAERWSGKGRRPSGELWAGLVWTTPEEDRRGHRGLQPSLREKLEGSKTAATRGPWQDNPTGWFCAAYGPFRRMVGGTPDAQRLMSSLGPVSRLATRRPAARRLPHPRRGLRRAVGGQRRAPVPAARDERRLPHRGLAVDRALYERIVYGSGDDAVLSDLFGLDTPNSERAQRLRAELVEVWVITGAACATCNSNLKRDRFPVAADGTPLLVDPTVEDPFEHLLPTPALGQYVGLTDKGRATIEVFDLNRPVLTQGREQAHRVVVMALHKWAEGRERGAAEQMLEAVLTVRGQPLADVCQAMLRLAEAPGAARVLDSSVLPILRDAELRNQLLV
uniref:hypothetical protein n=1 Tax=Saccharothrix mutabilis TaxID=33921 RepID=UPI0031DA81DA